jgi:two-component system, OmpR family, response regulator
MTVSEPETPGSGGGRLVLVVDDEPQVLRFLRASLGAHGYRLVEATTGEQALVAAATRAPDLVLLDLGLPDLDGVEVARRLREWSAVPVVVLSARGQENDKIRALDAGADDYLTKPFKMPELSARVRAILRRAKSAHGAPVFELGDVTFDTRTKNATRNGEPVELTAQEASVLSYLFHNAGRYVSNGELVDHVYEFDRDRESNTIAVFILRLRKKLGAELIETSRGRGYRISLPS